VGRANRPREPVAEESLTRAVHEVFCNQISSKIENDAAATEALTAVSTNSIQAG
jgi:hypothetical protein